MKKREFSVRYCVKEGEKDRASQRTKTNRRKMKDKEEIKVS